MLDHISIAVRSVPHSKLFYAAVLHSLGYGVVQESAAFVGFGVGKKPEFGLFAVDTGLALMPQHIAFAAESRAAVDRWYVAALAAGGVCNGAPGVRPEYHANYYGAFVLDPDGNNVEAVCHAAP
jgi:catechol 2,3-dioxygenase-like lactoylglutathione lyase family enzyme